MYEKDNGWEEMGLGDGKKKKRGRGRRAVCSPTHLSLSSVF